MKVGVVLLGLTLVSCSDSPTILVTPVHKQPNFVGCLVIAKATNRDMQFAEGIEITAMATDHANDNLGYARDTQDIFGGESREFEFSFSDVDCSDIVEVGFNSHDALISARDGSMPSFEIGF